MGNIYKSILRLIVLFVSILSFVSCTKNHKKLMFGLDKSETIISNLQTEPPSLDWHKAVDTTSHEVTMNIMDGLTTFDYNDPNLKTLPYLAEKWSSDKSVKTWTFNLRKGVLWNDGVEFEAQQVVDGWERLLNPSTAAEYAYFLFNIKNAQDYNAGKITDFSKVGVKALDKYTLRVELNAPISFFPSLLAHHSTFPIRKDIIAKYGDNWTDPKNIVTLGAYNLKEWRHDDVIWAERNETYWGEKAKTKNILWRMITEQSSAINLFDSGELDIVPELPSNDINVLKLRKEYQKQSGLILYYYGFNFNEKPFDDLNFRKAFVSAIDKTEVLKILGRSDKPATSFVPVGMMGYEADMGISFNPEKAKMFLESSKYKDINKVPKISISFNTSENHQKIAENVQAQIKRNLGLSIELKNEEWKVYLSKLKTKKNYSIFRMGWAADYPDPDNFLNLMTSYSANNHTNWADKKYDDLIAKGVSELNEKKRHDIYRDAQKILLEEAVAVIPLYYHLREYLVQSRIKGFKLNPLDHKVYKDVEVK